MRDLRRCFEEWGDHEQEFFRLMPRQRFGDSIYPAPAAPSIHQNSQLRIIMRLPLGHE